MKYDVMIRCPVGTMTLYNDVWEVNTHVITWCHCATWQEAEQIVRDLLAGANAALLDVWYQERS